MRAGLHRVVAALGAVAALAPCGCDRARQTAFQPPERIVLVVVDTLRRDHVARADAPVATPHIDALARRGQLVEGAVSSYHQTSSSMASLFTGRTPSFETGEVTAPLPATGRTWCGLRRFATPGDDACVPRSLPTLAEAVRAQGYWTAGVATNPFLFRPAGYDRGFDAWVEVGDAEQTSRARGGAAANRAVEALLAGRPTDRLFLYVHYMDAHDYLREERSYADSVAMADRAVGDLVVLLEDAGLLEDAVLVLTADHGERLDDDRHLIPGRRSHWGNPSFEEVLRVPLILVPALLPDPPPAALRSDDVHQLVRRIAGAEPLPERDLAPGELFVSESAYQTYRRGRFKSFRPRGDGLVLVDLLEDPEEQRDVAARHPQVAALHAERLDALSRALAVESAAPTRLTAGDRDRLRALGYLEDAGTTPDPTTPEPTDPP